MSVGGACKWKWRDAGCDAKSTIAYFGHFVDTLKSKAGILPSCLCRLRTEIIAIFRPYGIIIALLVYFTYHASTNLEAIGRPHDCSRVDGSDARMCAGKINNVIAHVFNIFRGGLLVEYFFKTCRNYILGVRELARRLVII